MLSILATMLQIAPTQALQPLYAENTSIWRHMSDALNQSLYRVLSLLVTILPGILAFIVAMAVFTLIGMALSALLRRGLTAAKFDDRLARSRGNIDWAPSTSPTALVARCLLRNGHNAHQLANSVPYPICRGRLPAHRRHSHRAFPGPFGPHRSSQ